MIRMRPPLARFTTACFLAITAAGAATGQTYPVRPVRVIVQFPPGGTPDIYGRIMASELAKLWNQSVVVENRTGASGTIGTDVVARSAPDGYNLLFAADAAIVIAPHLYSKLPYDPVRDLTPIVNVAGGPFVLLVNPSVPIASINDLVKAAKEHNGKLAYASSGTGSNQHLSMELIRSMTGIDMVHIPYKGFGQALTDVLAGQVPMLFGGVTATLGIVRTGKLRAVGITSAKRSAGLPDVPAIAETLPGLEVLAWYGFMGPANMPRELVRKIHADVVTIVNRADFRERLAKDAIEPIANTPEEFAAQIKADLAKWEKVVKASGAKAE